MRSLTVHRSGFDRLRPDQLYAMLRLRSEVFVVEQDCVFLDLDDRDRESDAVHMWTEDATGVTATLRILDTEGSLPSIGRVVTRADVRSSGVASRLLRDAIALLDERGGQAIRLEAQAHLAEWYGAFGFVVTGEAYTEDGIDHVSMRRTRP